jgi:hypothetical protein
MRSQTRPEFLGISGIAEVPWNGFAGAEYRIESGLFDRCHDR